MLYRVSQILKSAYFYAEIAEKSLSKWLPWLQKY